MKLTLSAAFALFAAVLAIPPEDFGFPSAPNDTILSAGFPRPGGAYQTMTEGILFGWGIPGARPVLGLQTSVYQSLAEYTGQYVVFMVDPDARYPQAPTSRWVLHWMQPNMTLSNTTTDTLSLGLLTGSQELTNLTAPAVEYARPQPPSNSSAHRYILYAFEQPANFSVPSQYSGYGGSNRTGFNFTRFVADTHLGTPAAANYMYVTNETSVPTDFVVAAGGTYPGGNGEAVTSGDPGASVLATATSSSASMTGSSSASRTSGASASSGASSSASAQASSTSSAAAAMITGASGLIGAGLLGLAALL